MIQPRGEVIVGVLGPWASGKTTAARTLVNYLGGEDEVVFINDRVLLAGQAVNHIRELGDSRVKRTTTDDGGQRLAGERAIVYLGPGQDLETVIWALCSSISPVMPMMTQSMHSVIGSSQ